MFYPDTLDWANSEGKTALHVASLRGNEELVRVCHLNGSLHSIPSRVSNITHIDALRL